MEKAKNDKLNNSLRLMYVKEIIFERTDEDHFLNTFEILDILEKDYQVSVTRQTLAYDIDILIEAGYDIECIQGRPNKYHVLSREFDIAELRILIDVVCSLRSLPYCKAKDLTKKLARLGGPAVDLLMETINIESIPRTDNTQIYYIIDAVLKAKTRKKQIEFKYYEYSTANIKALKNGGKKYTVTPYQLVCSNEFYYLLGYSEKHEKITAFRVDRICGIPEIINKSFTEEHDDLEAEKYIGESNHMMTGETTTVTLRFDSSVMDAMVDRFGQDMDITFSTKNVCIAKVSVVINKVFFAWIFGFDGKVMISGPTSVQDEFIRLVSRMMARL